MNKDVNFKYILKDDENLDVEISGTANITDKWLTDMELNYKTFTEVNKAVNGIYVRYYGEKVNGDALKAFEVKNKKDELKNIFINDKYFEYKIADNMNRFRIYDYDTHYVVINNQYI